MMTIPETDLEKAKLNLETAAISWHELQRPFAAGLTIAVSEELDLIECAYQIAQDNKPQVEQWLGEQKIAPVSDEQARCWHETQVEVWAIVVKPWVLVQAIRPG